MVSLLSFGYNFNANGELTV